MCVRDNETYCFVTTMKEAILYDSITISNFPSYHKQSICIP